MKTTTYQPGSQIGQILGSAISANMTIPPQETIASLIENIEKSAISIQSMVEAMDAKLHGHHSMISGQTKGEVKPCVQQSLQDLNSRLNGVRNQLESMHESIG